jgi:hypothetical protein
MYCHWEYHANVRRRIPASVALFGFLLLPAFFVSTGFAQATSAGGHSFASASASSPSIGSHDTNLSSSIQNTPVKSGASANSGHYHPWHRGSIGEIYYPFPYMYPQAGEPDNESESESDDNDADYQGGPTIFDRRGSGADSYVPPVRKVPTPHAGVASAALSVPDVPQEPTLLIFKDGHKLEVENYAVVGPTLVDLTPGHQHTVALASLDLSATRQQNKDRGIIFHGPQQQVPRAN